MTAPASACCPARMTSSGTSVAPLNADCSAAVLVALDDALKELAEFDGEKARLVELRYFAGLSVEETAQAMGISVSSVMRSWRSAKAWLMARINS